MNLLKFGCKLSALKTLADNASWCARMLHLVVREIKNIRTSMLRSMGILLLLLLNCTAEQIKKPFKFVSKVYERFFLFKISHSHTSSHTMRDECSDKSLS